MTAFIDVSSAPLARLEDALVAKEPVRIQMHPGGVVLAPKAMLWPETHAEIMRPHAEPVLAEDVSTFVIPDIDLAGSGASPMRDGGFLLGADMFPSYIAAFVANDVDVERWRPAAGTEALEVETAFSLVHYNLIYGHWLLEMLPKLFTIRDLMHRGVKGEIVLPVNTPSYVTDYIDLIAPGAAVRWFDPQKQHVHAARAICPGMFNIHYHFHPALGLELDALVAGGRHRARGVVAEWLSRLAGRAPAKGQDRKRLFISRRHMAPSYRAMTNQAEIEMAARRMGLTVVSPEQFSIREQIRVFADAELIVGEFGSGMHNAMFAPARARIVCLNWISEVQSRLANLRGQSVGYILPSDGRPRTFHFEEVQDQFTIDPAEFEAKVGGLMHQAAA